MDHKGSLQVSPVPEFEGEKYYVPNEGIPDKAAFIGACVNVCVCRSREGGRRRHTPQTHTWREPSIHLIPWNQTSTPGLFANDLAIGGPTPPKSAEEYEAASEEGNIAGLVWRVDYDKEKG